MPLFITLEGMDGSGKSTQAARLIRRLQDEGYDVAATREPGGTLVGDQVRQLLLGSDLQMNVITQALLFAAARSELVQQVIMPALAQGRIIVSDRYVDSSAAYQAYGGGLPVEYVSQVNMMATGGIKPHRTLLLDLPVSLAMQRMAQKRQDRFQGQDADFHERVRNGYLELVAADPRRIKVIDAARDADTVAEAVWELVREVLPKKRNQNA